MARNRTNNVNGRANSVTVSNTITAVRSAQAVPGKASLAWQHPAEEHEHQQES